MFTLAHGEGLIQVMLGMVILGSFAPVWCIVCVYWVNTRNKARRDSDVSRCAHCRYVLTGLAPEATVCPECGWNRPSGKRGPPVTLATDIVVAVLAAILGIFVVGLIVIGVIRLTV